MLIRQISSQGIQFITGNLCRFESWHGIKPLAYDGFYIDVHEVVPVFQHTHIFTTGLGKLMCTSIIHTRAMAGGAVPFKNSLSILGPSGQCY